MLNKIKNIFATISLALLFSCNQGEPPPIVEEIIPGDFEFSGYQWNYKNAATPVGPGPNRFSGTTDFAWVDNLGYLHLKIAKKDNQWNCSEIISTKVVGYGTYIMTCMSDISTFNEKAVFGFFTWDSYSFQSQANSEIDIEFSRWNNASDSNLINFAVQPVIFSNPIPYSERSYKAPTATSLLKEPITHMFRWTPDSVHYESYAGVNYPGTNKIATWTFTNDNMPRQKIEGPNTSDPIVIPAPSDSSNVRFNLWLLNGAAPSNNQEHEVIISSFSYVPL